MIDWRREPQRDIRTGISWLIKDETNYNEPEDDEADSISEKGLFAIVENKNSIQYTL